MFYHLTLPDHLRYEGGDSWTFYIGRPGTSASQCIDWTKEGIRIEAYGPNYRWGECRVLIVTPGARVRITYPFGYGKRTHEIVLLRTPSFLPLISNTSFSYISLALIGDDSESHSLFFFFVASPYLIQVYLNDNVTLNQIHPLALYVFTQDSEVKSKGYYSLPVCYESLSRLQV